MAYENVCYLIHCETPVNKAGAQHYIGFTNNLERRIRQHRGLERGGAGFLQQANVRGIPWRVIRVWRDASYDAEKRLKLMGGKNLCPVCYSKKQPSQGMRSSLKDSPLNAQP